MTAPMVVIPAGGAGTRLRSAIGETAKILAPIDGRPFLSIVLGRLAEYDVDRVHLCLGRYAAQVIAWIESSVNPCQVTWSVETTPLGVWGGIAKAEAELSDPFVVCYGDVMPFLSPALLSESLGDDAAGVVACWKNLDHDEKSNMLVESGWVCDYRKEATGYTHLDLGMGAFAKSVFAHSAVNGGVLDEQRVLSALVSRRLLRAYETDGPVRQIGDVDHYAAFLDAFVK